MSLIKEYSDFLPKDDLIDKYYDMVEDKYKIIFDISSGYKVVLVDEKIYYLTGPFANKSRLISRVYYDMTNDVEYHSPSLRKAIKLWIDKNS